MKLHYHPASTACRPIMLLAAEEQIPLELELVDLFAGAHLSDRFIAINPNHAVPVLEDGAFLLTESSAILKYLAERNGSAAYPVEPQARARTNALMDWFNTGFYREFGYGVVYPQVLPEYAWPDPSMRGLALAKATRGSRHYLDVLDRNWLVGEAPFLGGASPTLADFMGASYVTIGALVEFDLTPWPRVGRWLKAMEERPSWAPVNVAFKAWCEMASDARHRKGIAA